MDFLNESLYSCILPSASRSLWVSRNRRMSSYAFTRNLTDQLATKECCRPVYRCSGTTLPTVLHFKAILNHQLDSILFSRGKIKKQRSTVLLHVFIDDHQVTTHVLAGHCERSAFVPTTCCNHPIDCHGARVSISRMLLRILQSASLISPDPMLPFITSLRPSRRRCRSKAAISSQK